jgi:uncharacterized alkaline shock family protein YloU
MSRDDLVTESPLGRVVVTGSALAAHATQAAHAVSAARVRRSRRGLGISVGDETLHVALSIDVGAGSSLAAVGRSVQEAVSDAIARTTGRLVTVDVAIDGLDLR